MSSYYPFQGEPQGQPQGQLYSNPTGYQRPQGQQFGQQQPQQTGFQPQQNTFQFQQPQFNEQMGYGTGFRQSAQTGDVGSSGAPSYATEIGQLSFLTPQDQDKFKNLFNSSTTSVSISPENARSILMKSNLNPHQLARIWDLSDLNKSGDLLFPEFALALHLCNVALRGNELPYYLDPKIKEEVTGLVDKISFSIPEEDATQSNRPVAQPNISASSIFTQPQQQQSQQTGYQQPPIANLTSQPTGFGFGNGMLSEPTSEPQTSKPTAFQPQPTGFQPQATGFQSQLSTQNQPQQTGFQSSSQAQPIQPFQPQATGFKPQTTGFGNFQSNFQSMEPMHPQNEQKTGFEQSSSLQQQATGFHQQTSNPNQQQPLSSNSLQQQPTGLIPLQNQPTGLNQQPTGLVPLKTGNTGNQPLNQQPTGLVPLQGQNTGGQPLKQQPTGLVPLQGQNTGGQPLKQQPTGLVPLQGQNTGGQPLKQQPTGNLIPLQPQTTGHTSSAAPLSTQLTGGQPLSHQLTGGQPLTQQRTGLVPLATTATGSVALQTQLTGPAPLQSQRTGFGNFEPLRQQKTGVGQNSLFLQNMLQNSQQHQQQQQQQQQQQMFSSNSLNYTTESTSPQEKHLFNRIFENYDTNKKGLLTAEVSAEIFRKSGLNRGELEKVWDLVTRPNQTHLDRESFQMGMWLIYKRLNGFDLPDTLPESLKPSSIKILDDVKNQLRINPSAKNMKKSSNSRIDGTRFKNNDDDLLMTSSRNRRRTTGKTNTEGATGSKPKENLSIDEIKKRIREKQILLDAFDATDSQLEEKEKDYEKEDLDAIARLKQEIKNLPNVNNSNNDESSQLKQKFHNLTSKVPLLINDIAQVDNEITRLKLELYKLKNPSFIIGSGPNGEVTEADRRKAKSKALLAAKMAKLTGKPIDPGVQNLSDEQGKLDQEAIRIQQENKKNQQIIREVESSIKEISNNVINSFNSKVDENDYKKWELGIGVQPEVQQFIKSFKINDISNRFTAMQLEPQYPTSAPIGNLPTPQTSNSPTASIAQTSQSQQPVQPSHSSHSSPIYKTAEERKAYIKEQAKKKMNEKLAKFGIRSSSPKTPINSSPAPSISQPDVSPQVTQQQHGTPKQPLVAHESPMPQNEPALGRAPALEDDSSDDDDDEAEFQRMEEIRRLKKLERDERLAQLKAEEEQTETSEPQQQSQVSEPQTQQQGSSEARPARTFHESNPFAF